MDTDEDSEKNVDKSMEEEQEEYTIPPMEEWIPVEKKQTSTSLNFKPVELPSSCDGPDGKLVRSTVLERSGPSVITGPPPRELSWEERHSSSAMLMASYEELHLHLSSMKKKFSTPRQKGRPPPSHSRELEYELQAAVMPWIGNLLIPKTRRKTAADELRERGEKSGVSTSSIFLLLLQAMNVDTLGCREMIEQRKNKVDLLAPPAAPTTSTMLGPKRVSELLKKMGSRRTQQEEDNQRRLMLQQLEEAVFPQSLLLPAASIYIAPAGASLSAPPNLRLPNSQLTFIPAVGTSAGMGGVNAGKNKRSSASSPKQSRARRSHSKNSAICPAPLPNKTTGVYLLPSQSMWVMTSTGPVPLVQAPPPALQVRVPNTALLASQAPPTLTAGSSQLVGLNPAATTVLNEPRPSPILPTCNFRPLLPTIIKSHDLNPTSSLLPPPKIVLPYKGVVKVDPMKPPPLRRVGLHFDSTLLFLEPPEAVHDWLSGKGGVAIPGARSALPYLPPCVSTLSTLSALLQAKKSLTMSSLQLLNITDKRRCPRTPPDPTHSASDEPDSERSTAEEQPGSSSDPPYTIVLSSDSSGVFVFSLQTSRRSR
ncbi:hypothetical protein XENOCAPTIV_012500 [Xenoophorus captivus]|uniref:Uncharacterized protein n=1 Tax=Xenoophorus captivus TaxID=1517983 RepID=A0ABV0QHX1_9TELE